MGASVKGLGLGVAFSSSHNDGENGDLAVPRGADKGEEDLGSCVVVEWDGGIRFALRKERSGEGVCGENWVWERGV